MTTPKRDELPDDCQDMPDTHTWSNDYKDIEQGMSRYCTKCGLLAIDHTMRTF